MKNVFNGMVAGFVATVVLSLLMLMKSAMGLMPELDVISMLSTMMGGGQAMGWAAHFMIGTVVWGTLFALIGDKLPGGAMWVKGVVFGVIGWLLMMVMIMPMAGAGLFGMNLGIMAPVMTLMLHLIFGAVLGAVYGAMSERHPRTLEKARY